MTLNVYLQCRVCHEYCEYSSHYWILQCVHYIMFFYVALYLLSANVNLIAGKFFPIMISETTRVHLFYTCNSSLQSLCTE